MISPSLASEHASGPAPASRRITSAALAVLISLSFYNGSLEPFSLAAMTAAAAAVLSAALAPRWMGAPSPDQPRTWTRSMLTRALAGGIAVSLALHLLLPPGFEEDWPRLTSWRPLVCVAAVLAASYGWRRSPPLLVRARFPLFLALAVVMAAAVIRAVPHPDIDVWSIQQRAAEGLLRGANPYTQRYPILYPEPLRFLSKEVLSADGRSVVAYPYQPLVAILGAGVVACLGDVRWLMLASMLVGAVAIRRLGRGTLVAELCAVLFLYQPRGFFVVRQSWTDPLVLAALSLTLVAAARWRERDGTGGASWVATGVAAGCVAACKQYAPLFLVPLLFAVPARGRWKAAALALCVASATMAPFALWSPRAFYDGVIGFQLTSPFRTDALSWLAAVAYLGGPRLPSWLSIALALATLAAALRPRSTLSQAMTAASAAFLVLLLLGKQAFCNYYWLAGGLLLTVLALDSGGEAARGGSSLEANEEPASDRPGSERSQAAGTLRVFRGSLPAR